MNLNTVETKINNNPGRSFAILLAVLVFYQLLLAFQGFELCDTGFYATFYQNIFSNPSSVEGNFGYWFTGILGGLFIKIFPDSGLLGIRILGIITVSFTIVLVYQLLKKHISKVALYLGLIIVTISFIGEPVEFMHNKLSSLFFVAAALSIYKGLEKDNLLWIVFCGILLALNVFTRLPNLLDIGIAVIFIIHAFYYKETKWICFKRILVLSASFLISIICVLGIMKIIGHYEIYLNQLLGLKEVASGNTKSSHNLLGMIRTNIGVYGDLLIYGSFLSVLILSLAFFLDQINLNDIKRKTVKWLICFLVFLILIYFINKIPFITLIYCLSIISLSLNIYVKDIKVKILSWMGLFMLIIMPLGSDGSIGNFGLYAIWIAVPLAINLYMTKFYYASISLNINSLNKQLDYQFVYYSKLVLSMLLIFFVSKTFFQSINKSYFDPGSRIHKTYSINNPKVKYLFTTKERAKVVTELLEGIKPFVKDGDYLIAHESIPMIYYLTNTKPYLNDSWFAGKSSSYFLSKLENVLKENKPLPLVLRQKFRTIGYFGEPSDEYLSDNQDDGYINRDINNSFNRFLTENRYGVIWQNSHFILYAPQNNP
jgi:hypothetical protein